MSKATDFPLPSSPLGTVGGERVIYTVSRLNREVRLLLEQHIGVLWVEGELTNLAQPASGHWYFSLKDRDAQVRCAMFRQRNASVTFAPKNGQHVLARGRVSVFEPRGDYQLLVEYLEEAGVGALQREFERLKHKLATEGLFAQARKRPLPRFPRRIGVITSPSGAAVRDILHILARRFPPAAVLVYPTPVQGSAAVPAIVDAIELASARAECDVVILARGGGSLEDLWAFNDEQVARAIYASSVPIVTGIGHEIDFTIADFVADARAPTPSAAAELVTPDRAAIEHALARTTERLAAGMRRDLRSIATRLAGVRRRLKLAHPGARMLQQAQRLDDLEQRLTGATRAALRRDRHRLGEASARLRAASPGMSIRDNRARYEELDSRLSAAIAAVHRHAQHRFDLAKRALNAVDPQKTLERGYAIVRRAADGVVLRNSAAVALGEDIEAQLARGRVRGRITQKSPPE